jgi:hypothetical protein
MRATAADQINVTAERSLFFKLWGPYLRFLNAPEPATDSALLGAWRMHRHRIGELRAGRAPAPNGHHAEAPLQLTVTDGIVRWTPKRAYDAAWADRGPAQRSQVEKQFDAALMLLALPENQGLLQCCDDCARYFLRKQAHRRRQAFCAPKCRYAFHRKRRSKRAQRDYMRAYRAQLKRRAELKRGVAEKRRK